MSIYENETILSDALLHYKMDKTNNKNSLIRSYLLENYAYPEDYIDIVYKGKIDWSQYNHLYMSESQLLELSKNEKIEFGVHTYNHPVLSKINDTNYEKEILQSKGELESLLDREITSIAYPYGGKADLNDSVLKYISNNGFISGVTTCNNYITDNQDLINYNLPRIELLNNFTWNKYYINKTYMGIKNEAKKYLGK